MAGSFRSLRNFNFFLNVSNLPDPTCGATDFLWVRNLFFRRSVFICFLNSHVLNVQTAELFVFTLGHNDFWLFWIKTSYISRILHWVSKKQNWQRNDQKLIYFVALFTRPSTGYVWYDVIREAGLKQRKRQKRAATSGVSWTREGWVQNCPTWNKIFLWCICS